MSDFSPFKNVAAKWRKERKQGLCFLHPHVTDLDSSYHHFGAATAWRLSPWDQQCILKRRAPIRNSAHPNWHLAGHERLACSWVPAALLRALYPRESLHHSLSAIHEEHSSKPPAHMCTRTHTSSHLMPSASHPHLHFTFHTTHFIIFTYHTDVTASLLKLWATRTSV